MERFTVKATFNGDLSQRPSYQINETSPYTTSIQSKPSLRDASFSSYLPPQNPKQVPEDMEISIFDAERYFNETQDQKDKKKKFPVSINLDRMVDRSDVSTINRLSSVSSVDGYGRNYRTGSFNATPTASSEASWNSQSGLLSNPPGSIAVSMRNLPLHELKKGSSNKWFFGRKCPCSGKKSVDVKEKLSESKSSIPLHTKNGFLNQKNQGCKAGEVVVVVDKADEEKTKEVEKSLEIEEGTKMKILAGNWAKDEEIIRGDSGEFSPENCFPAELSRCVIPSNRSFSDAGGFSFPILNPPAATSGKLLLNAGKPLSPLEDPPRESLEVFRPRPMDETPTRKSTEFQKRLLMSLPGDSDRRSFTFPASPTTRATATDDDVASDSSSDLFEIESFSTQTTSYPMYRRRDSLEEMSGFDSRPYVGNGAGILHFRRSFEETASIAPTECYEPSEVSVDWSVTTAEGFDRGSVTNYSTTASEYEVRFIHLESGKSTAGASGGGGKRRANGLLSCRCEKAVNVAPHPVKCVGEQRRVSPPKFPVELGQIPAAARLANITSTQAKRSSEKPPLARSYSARMSRPLATR